jgi:hypothetical protein
MLASLIRHRVPSLDDADRFRRQSVLVAGDRDAFQGGRPILFDGESHRGSRLAGGGDEGAALWRRREVRAEDLERIGRRDGGAEALF